MISEAWSVQARCGCCGCPLGPGAQRERQQEKEKKEEGRKCGFYLPLGDYINKLNGSARVCERENILEINPAGPAPRKPPYTIQCADDE